MPAAADDYRWIYEKPFGELIEGYCATLVRGMTPQDFLRAMRAEADGDLRGYAELSNRTWACWDEFEDDRLLIGATVVPGDGGDWVLGLEINGYLGIQRRLVEPVSRGTRLISHFRNVNAVGDFNRWEDGELRTEFEPLFPTQRGGAAPDELVPLMAEVGFDLDEHREQVDFDPTACAFALAERLTGVRLTADVLSDATFSTGLVAKGAY
ncbi:DUF6461 domain-containing protein [Actinomadura rifamycini]|uniref:DUF6461 domain-containing protein n=1 Tax=Actinomadura rifamycini TaxID=31962 RepID=UPI0004088335|nr:DUF6461 domain-containing protein [Actinomadura rifamycini]